MLERVDRIQLAVTDRDAVAAAFARLLGAEVLREDAVAPLAARRCVLQLGASEIELLAPDGAGPVADHLDRSGPGLFAAGFSSARLDDLRARLVERELPFAEAGDQLLLAPDATGGHGLRCVISPPAAAGATTGPVSFLYEVTNLVGDASAVAADYAALFALDQALFCPIDSAEFGYRGVLTLFAPETRLDRIECITPYDVAKTMGRFMQKRGESLYMCFAEAPDLAAIVPRLEEHAAHDWSPSGSGRDTLFIHPRALGGLLMGISRESVGWQWSGHPERVRPAL
jgi:hypothetical protein